MVIELNSPRTLTDQNISFFLVDSTGRPVAQIAEEKISVTPVGIVTLSLKTDKLTTGKGIYGLRFVLKDADNRDLESSDILGVKVNVE